MFLYKLHLTQSMLCPTSNYLSAAQDINFYLFWENSSFHLTFAQEYKCFSKIKHYYQSTFYCNTSYFFSFLQLLSNCGFVLWSFVCDI